MLRQTLIAGGLLALCGPGLAFAQPPGPPRGERGGPGGGGVEAAIAKLMAFDADKDGKLSKAEVTDARLMPLWERCDADKDGVVTKDELTAQLTKEAATLGGGRGGPGGGGFGGPPGGGPGGPPPGGPEGGPRFGGPPAPGQILPPFLQEELRLSEAQRQQLSDLQKDIDAKLAQILTREQRQQLRDMANRGPRGPGGPGGPGGERGPGGPGGNRPPGEGRPQRPPQ